MDQLRRRQDATHVGLRRHVLAQPVVVHFWQPEDRKMWAALQPFERELRRRIFVLVDDLFMESGPLEALEKQHSASDVTVLATSRGYQYRQLGDITCEIVSLDTVTPEERSALLALLKIDETRLRPDLRRRITNAQSFFDLPKLQ